MPRRKSNNQTNDQRHPQQQEQQQERQQEQPKKQDREFSPLSLGLLALVPAALGLGYVYFRYHAMITKVREQQEEAGAVYADPAPIPESLFNWLETVPNVQVPFILLSQIIALAFRQIPEGDTCLTTTPNDIYPGKKIVSMLDCYEPTEVVALQKQGKNIDDKEGSHENTLMHFHVMNHNYRPLLRIYKALSREDKHRAAIATDINGRTPFYLSAVIAAPGRLQRALMTPENVVIADHNGVTPLMLAASGTMNEMTTRHLLHMIGPKRLAQALAAKDNYGRSVQDYSRMSKEKIRASLEEFVIDPDRASNYCYNSFEGEKKKICTTTDETRALLPTYYSLGSTHQCAESVECIQATKKNVETYLEMDRSSAPQYQQMQKNIFNNFHREYPTFSANMWRSSYSQDAKNLLASGLSDKSLIDSIMEQQQSNRQVIKEVQTKLKH